ncbi:MAG: efflux RND transporter periplasmic adaptor subunit [Candidatus Paceibacterota bacterium]
MNTAIAFLKSKAGITIAALVVLAGGYFFVQGSRKTVDETLVVHPADFIQQVSVSGTVKAAQTVDLGFAASGRISAVYGKVGDTVAAGRPLAAIENGDLRAAIQQKQALLQNQEAKLAALKEGTRQEEVAVAQEQVNSDKTALAQNQQALLNAIQNAYTQSDNAIHNSVDQFVNGARTQNPHLSFSTSNYQLQTSFEFKRLDIESMLTAWQKSVAGLRASDDLIRAASEAQANLTTVASFLSDANTVLSTAIANERASQSTIDAWTATITSVRTNINSTVTSVTSAMTAMMNASATLQRDEKNLSLKMAGATQADIDAQNAQIASARADVENAQANLAKTVVTAPFTGVITRMDAKVGMIVSPNVPEISMNSASTYQIESYVPEVSIALVKTGNAAVVTLDAYGEEVPFAATVVSIDPAGTVRDGVPTYRVLLQFSGADARIRSGMTANIVITTAQRSGVISIPQKLVVTRDGKKYVTVKTGETSTERAVTTGSVSSLGNIEIVTGLVDGDLVVMTPGK